MHFSLCAVKLGWLVGCLLLLLQLNEMANGSEMFNKKEKSGIMI